MALATDAHAEALEAAIWVLLAQMERAVRTLVAQASHHIVLWTQSGAAGWPTGGAAWN